METTNSKHNSSIMTAKNARRTNLRVKLYNTLLHLLQIADLLHSQQAITPSE